VALVIAATALLMLPPLYEFHSAISGWYAVTMLVPQAVPLAIPIGVGLGIAFGLRAQHTVNTAKLILLAAMAASALSFGILAWAMPAGNQAFRENIVRGHGAGTLEGTFAEVPKGYNEMSLTELRHEIAHFSAKGEPRRAREYAHHLHLRISLAVATLALGVLMLAAPVNHRGSRGLLALAACFVYWALIFVGESAYRQGYVTPPTGAWLPNVVLIATAIVIASSRSSRLGGSATSAR
jgi:lipopolysaccharide export LptBFGC system permease protein LptF